jgi:hypothetical protein
MYGDTLEISRALIADLGATLGDQPEFQRHAELVSAAMPVSLARAIHFDSWIVEPFGGDLAGELGRRYGQGHRRSRIAAVFLREAAAALQFVPPEWRKPREWSQTMMMNLGGVACTPEGQAAGVTKRPSLPALASRDRGCRAIARRGAGRCVVCGVSADRVHVSGATVNRTHQPFACSAACSVEERYFKDAMATVFDRCEWLLAEAMTLRVELLPG